MDTKRVVLAIVLSVGVLVFWSYYFAPEPAPRQAPAPQQTTQQPAGTGGQTTRARPAPGDTRVFETGEFTDSHDTTTVETPLYVAEVSDAGVLSHFKLKKYKESIEDGAPSIDLVTREALSTAPMGLIYNGTGTWKTPWTVTGSDLDMADGESGRLAFSTELDGVRLVRELEFRADSYLVTETLRIANDTPSQVQARVAFTMASQALTSDEDRYNKTSVAYLGAGGVDKEDDIDDLEEGVIDSSGIQWGAIQSNYFMLALAPSLEGTTFKARYDGGIYRMAVEAAGLLVDPGRETSVVNTYFLGPKKEKRLEEAPNNLDEAISYGFFDIIAKPLMQMLKWFHGLVGNWGVAIILLTIVIKIIFWPLSHKSYKSMNKMKKIQPMMAKIREKHKDDRQKMNQEMMQLYKTYKVNPAGGCLPMMVQIPVFIGLYQALLGAIELRHAPFMAHVPFTDIVWLADLSAKDPFYVTPLVMGASMFLQQKLTPSPGDPTQAKIMLFMPVIFTFIFLQFPSGLVVYWLVNNVLSIAQQWWLTRKA
jgi:YidC/Oxa1 family membrane protein insertase